MADTLPNRRLKSKSEQMADDLANDLKQVTDQVNTERKSRGEKPVEVETSRGYEGRG
jgi:uncharacterized membrane-anchored protein